MPQGGAPNSCIKAATSVLLPMYADANGVLILEQARPASRLLCDSRIHHRCNHRLTGEHSRSTTNDGEIS